MYWILILQIILTPCQGNRCELAQPASAPFTRLEDCEQARAFIISWGGDGSGQTLQDAARGSAGMALTLTWACVPAHLSPAPKD
jgi:hypothetical protein